MQHKQIMKKMLKLGDVSGKHFFGTNLADSQAGGLKVTTVSS